MKEDARLSFHEFRADHPLTDDDFASIRRAVVNEIHSPERRPASTFLKPAIATAVVVVLVVAALVLSHPWPAAPIASRTSPPVAVRHATPPVVVKAPPPEAEVAAVPETPTRPARPHHTHRSQAAPAALVATVEQEPITIQLQTSNPDIRIIWIAQ